MSDVSEFFGVCDLKGGDIVHRFHEVNAVLDLPHRTFDFRMTFVAYHDQFTTLFAHAGNLDVYLGHQRAGGIEYTQPAPLGFFANVLRYAMCTEDDGIACRDLIEFLDENRAFRAKIIYHKLVVHDLMANVDRRAKAL